jgi:hypothetical protein
MHQKDITPLPEPGQSIRTEVYARERGGVWSLVKSGDPGSRCYFAEWRYPTVRLWYRVQSFQDKIPRENRLWVYFLLNTSLVSRVNFSGQIVDEETSQKIMKFSPGMIPAALLREFVKNVSLSNSENLRIERECYSLWSSEGSGGLKNPHPLLGEVIWAMGIYEKFGILTWDNVNDMHIKIYTVIRKVMECYAQSQLLNAHASKQRQIAQQKTGIGPGAVFRG